MWPMRMLLLILSTSKQIQKESIFYKEGICIAEYMLNNTSTENMSLQTLFNKPLSKLHILQESTYQYVGTCYLFVIDISYVQNLCHSELWVTGGIIPHYFNLGTRERWVVSFLSWQPGERAPCTCWTQGSVASQMGPGHCGEQRISGPTTNGTPNHAACNLVTRMTEVTLLIYSKSRQQVKWTRQYLTTCLYINKVYNTASKKHNIHI